MGFFNRLARTLRREDLSANLDEELRVHIEMRTADNIAAGMSPEAARRDALLRFGNLTATREDARAPHFVRLLENIAHDVRHALRGFRHSPGFTAAAVLTLALGIGATTAIFSIVHAALLAPLPYPEPERLVAVDETSAKTGDSIAMSPADLVDFQRLTTTLQDVAGVATVAGNLTGLGAPERLSGEQITANFFRTLGVQPTIGRAFTDEEDRFGGQKVVIITHDLWQSRLGSDPAVLTRTITLDDEPHQIVGVLPAGFKSPRQYQVRFPYSFYIPADVPPEILQNRNEHLIRAVGRLKSGVTPQQAQQELDAIVKELRSAPQWGKVGITVKPLQNDMVSRVRLALLVLMGAVALILLIAFVNVANLLLARALRRRREIGVRVALGATRARLVQALVTQSVVLTAFGCLAGAVLAWWTKKGLLALAPPEMPTLVNAGLNLPVLAISCGVALLIGTLFGLVPALHTSGAAPGEALKSESRTTDARSARWRHALVVLQLVLCVPLLVGTALLLRSFGHIAGVALGFDTEQVMVARIGLSPQRYKDGNARQAFFAELAARAGALPGVQSVAYANAFPMRGGWSGGMLVEEKPGTEVQAEANMQAVSPGYFATLGIGVQRGRGITADDRVNTPPVAVVNSQYARRFFPDQDPIGRRFRRHKEAPLITIVGVVGDLRRDGKLTAVEPEVYYPAAQTNIYPVRLAEFAVRTTGDPRPLLPSLQNVVWSIDKDQPITAVATLDETLSRSLAQRRFVTILLSSFSALSVLLAIVGIYGLLAVTVTQRRAEIGIRMALGARPRDAAWSVVRQAIVLVSGGAAAGLAGAAYLARFMRTLLFEIKPLDAPSFAVAAVVLALVALAACYLPARQAARVDPMVALRAE